MFQLLGNGGIRLGSERAQGWVREKVSCHLHRLGDCHFLGRPDYSAPVQLFRSIPNSSGSFCFGSCSTYLTRRRFCGAANCWNKSCDLSRSPFRQTLASLLEDLPDSPRCSRGCDRQRRPRIARPNYADRRGAHALIK